MNVLERIRPPEGNDIREMPIRNLFRKVSLYLLLAIVSFLSMGATSPGSWAYSASVVGTVAALALATPGAIELHARAGEWE